MYCLWCRSVFIYGHHVHQLYLLCSFGSYFNDSGSEDEGEGGGVESEEMARRRITREYFSEGGRGGVGGGGDEEDAEEDPLDAFMAGIEVGSVSLHHCYIVADLLLSVCRLRSRRRRQVRRRRSQSESQFSSERNLV